MTPKLVGPRSISEDQLFQIPLYDHVLDRSHRNFEEVRVCGVRKVAVNFLLGVAIQRAEFIHEVLARLLPIVGLSVVVRETMLGDWAFCQLFLEKIHLVKEQDQC